MRRIIPLVLLFLVVAALVVWSRRSPTPAAPVAQVEAESPRPLAASVPAPAPIEDKGAGAAVELPVTKQTAPSAAPLVPAPAAPVVQAPLRRPTPDISSSLGTIAAPPAPPPGEEDDPSFPATADGLREAVGYKKVELHECYEGWTRLDTKVAGKAKIRFELFHTEDGSTGMRDVALVDSELNQTVLEGCLVSVFRSMRFAPMEEPTLKVVFPMIFAPGDKK